MLEIRNSALTELCTVVVTGVKKISNLDNAGHGWLSKC